MVGLQSTNLVLYYGQDGRTDGAECMAVCGSSTQKSEFLIWDQVLSELRQLPCLGGEGAGLLQDLGSCLLWVFHTCFIWVSTFIMTSVSLCTGPI